MAASLPMGGPAECEAEVLESGPAGSLRSM